MAGRRRVISWAVVRTEAERVTTSMGRLGYGIQRLVNDVEKLLLVDSNNDEIGGLKYLFDEELNGSSLNDYWRNYYTTRDRVSLVQEQVRVTRERDLLVQVKQEQVKQEQDILTDEVPAVARLAHRDRDLLVQMKQEQDVMADEIARDRDLLVQVKQEHDILTDAVPAVARLARDRDLLVQVKREHDILTDATPAAILALKTALQGFKRTKLATVKGMIDVFALQMFRYWGGQPVTFKLSTSSTSVVMMPAISALRPLFDAAGIRIAFDRRYTMTREGIITSVDPYP